MIPHGTGTGLENGTSAVEGGVCVDLTRMEAIEDYHPQVDNAMGLFGLKISPKTDTIYMAFESDLKYRVCVSTSRTYVSFKDNTRYLLRYCALGPILLG